MELKELWLCKHIKNVRSSQLCISMNICTEFSKVQAFSASIVKIIKMIKRVFFINILIQEKLLLLNRKNYTRKMRNVFYFRKKTSAKGIFCKTLQWFMYNFHHMNYIYVNSAALAGFQSQFRKLSRKKALNSINSIYSKHSHKKWKDTLKTRAVMLIFLLEIKISGVAI